jgi:hypothetical protein
MPRRIDIEGPTRWKAVAWKKYAAACFASSREVTCHPWDPVVEGSRVPQMLRR